MIDEIKFLKAELYELNRIVKVVEARIKRLEKIRKEEIKQHHEDEGRAGCL